MEPMTADEQRAISGARRGDRGAFEWLVGHYQTPVFNLAYRLLGDEAEAEDAAQETFVRAYRQIQSFDPHRRFATWLLSITSHYCIDRLRRRKRFGPSLDDEGWSDWVAGEQPDPDDGLLKSEQVSEVQELLATLPDNYRTVITLKYWGDMPIEAIARVTGDSEGNVKVKLHRARQALAKAIKQRQREVEGRYAS